jgi:AraC-like DNA-binding protein
MQPEKGDSALLRFSTRDFPEKERIPFWREVFGRQICHIDIEPHGDGPMDIDATMLALPNLHVGLCRAATPACWNRTAELAKDGDDSFGFVIPLGGVITRFQRGDDVDVNIGEGAGILHAEPGGIRFRHPKHMVMMVPRAALTPLVADLQAAATRVVPRGNAALRLLRAYLGTLFENASIADATLRAQAATHIQDLVALAIGATRDGRAIAAARGARAARLSAIKDDFAADPSLTLAAIASRQCVTPRYVQMLFEADGTTFTAYAVDQRLTAAWRMLTSRRHAHLTIGAIVLASGFGDISHFNRLFRRRYGASPSEVRAAAAACSAAEAG